MRMCVTCGGRTRVQDSCSYCRRNGPPASDLPPGRWVKQNGGIRAYVPYAKTPPAPTPMPAPATYTLPHEFCEACDALLLPDEWCPCSRSWARRAAVEHPWPVIPFSTPARLEVAA